MRQLSEATFFFPHVLLIVAAIGAAVSYIRPIEPRIHPALGFAGIAALLLFALYFGTWGGYPTQADLQYFVLGGFVPYSDAGGYYLGSFDVGYSGRWSWISTTRPLAAAFRDVVTGLGGMSYRPALIVQAIFTAGAITFAAWRVSRWLGPWSALGFVAFAMILARPLIGTTATETLGLIWSLIAVGFLADALRLQSFPAALLPIFCTAMAQMTRNGVVFIVPVMMLWAVIAFWEPGTRLKRIAAIVAVAAVPVLFSSLLNTLYGAKNVPAGWALSYLLCSVTRGTDWLECRNTALASGVSPSDIPALASAMYRLAWDAFVADPNVMLRGMGANLNNFAHHAPMRMIGGLNLHLGETTPYSTIMMALAVPGILIHLWRAPKSEWILWALTPIVIALGAAFLWNYDGWRTMYSSHAFIALAIAAGLRSGWPTDSPLNLRSATVAVAAICAAIVVAPAALHAVLATEKTENYGARSIAGALIIADDAPAPGVPFLRATQFDDAMKMTGLEREHGPFIAPTLAALPRSIFMAAKVSPDPQWTALFIGPPEIMLRNDVKAWRFTIVKPEWQKDGPLRIVEGATPEIP